MILYKFGFMLQYQWPTSFFRFLLLTAILFMQQFFFRTPLLLLFFYPAPLISLPFPNNVLISFLSAFKPKLLGRQLLILPNCFQDHLKILKEPLHCQYFLSASLDLSDIVFGLDLSKHASLLHFEELQSCF